MQKLNEPNTVPPDGYRYFQSETKTWIRASDYADLFLKVGEHRKANNLPTGTFWEAEVENQLCESLPPGQCKESIPGQGRNFFTRVSWAEIVEGTQIIATGAKTLVGWAGQALSGQAFVDQDLADRRADICSRCYFNVSMSGGCHSCGQVAKLAMTIVGTRRTKADPFLRACAVCKCALAAKVWVPIEALDRGEGDTSRYPTFCWVRSELEVYRKEHVGT